MTSLVRKATSLFETRPVAMPRAHKETDMEHRMRKERSFDEVELKLPNVKLAPASDGRPALITNILSYLGSWNPIPLSVSANDTVWLFDNTAYKNSKTGNWEAEFVSAVFDQGTGVEISTVVADLAEKLGIGEGDAQEATIKARLMPFMQSILPGRIVKISFAERAPLKLGPGGRNGISSDIKQVPHTSDKRIIKSVASVPQGANGLLQMNTVFAEPQGWGVISDVDDTIKITQTSDPIGILRSTFVSPPAPVAGMPELYSWIESKIGPAAPFFYLSASPYNLYPFLSLFRQKYFPQGTLILRDSSWMNLAGLLSNLTLGTEDYKVDRIEKVNDWLPQRKMILIGDSTQSDPEAYGEIYRKNKDWVKLILIRRVDDIAAIGIEEKNEAVRFEKAFKNVPKTAWHVFDDPKECYQLIDSMVSKEK